MNVDSIIEEELSEARERIKGRIASLLMGGDGAPPPRASVAKDRSRPGRASNAPISMRTRAGKTGEDAEVVLAFLTENPGTFSEDLMEHLGVTGSTDRRYINVMKLLWKRGLVLSRGKGRATAYYLNEDPPEQPLNEQPEHTKQGGLPPRADKLTRDQATARDKRLLIYIAKNPNTLMSQVVAAHESKTGMGTVDSMKAAIHRMANKGLILKKEGKGLAGGGHPPTLLRVKK